MYDEYDGDILSNTLPTQNTITRTNHYLHVFNGFCLTQTQTRTHNTIEKVMKGNLNPKS